MEMSLTSFELCIVRYHTRIKSCSSQEISDNICIWLFMVQSFYHLNVEIVLRHSGEETILECKVELSEI